MLDVIEDSRNEFKLKLNDYFEKEVIAFLNTDGGNIFIGVDGMRLFDMINSGNGPVSYDEAIEQGIIYNVSYATELTQGMEYRNGQYTYRYMQEDEGGAWNNISDDGWGVTLTDKDSTAKVDTALCTSINGKPIVSMSSMFACSNATELDLSSFDTSNVTDMSYMFDSIYATELDLSGFDTSNVTNMSGMFDVVIGNVSTTIIARNEEDSQRYCAAGYTRGSGGIATVKANDNIVCTFYRKKPGLN